MVDDQEVVRAGFGALLATQPDFAVVGTRRRRRRGRPAVPRAAPGRGADGRPDAGDGRHRGDPPDPRRAGADGPRVLILTTFDLDEYVYDALAAGASGFLLKDVTAERLFDAVRVVAAGEALLAPTVTRRLIGEFARLRARASDAARPALDGADTPRETEVLRLIAEGLSNPEIAARLVVGEETVKTHVSRVLAKLGLRDRTQAVVLAYESGPGRAGRGRRATLTVDSRRMTSDGVQPMRHPN